MPCHAGACHAALKRQFSTRSVKARCFELNKPRLHDEVGGRLSCLAGQSLSRPDKPHRRYAIVSPKHRGLARDIDAAVVVAHVGCARLPARHAGKRLERRDRHGLSRWEAAELDGNRRIDQRDRLIDHDHRRCPYKASERSTGRRDKSGGPCCERSPIKSNSFPSASTISDTCRLRLNIQESISANPSLPAPSHVATH